MRGWGLGRAIPAREHLARFNFGNFQLSNFPRSLAASLICHNIDLFCRRVLSSSTIAGRLGLAFALIYGVHMTGATLFRTHFARIRLKGYSEKTELARPDERATENSLL